MVLIVLATLSPAKVAIIPNPQEFFFVISSETFPNCNTNFSTTHKMIHSCSGHFLLEFTKPQSFFSHKSYTNLHFMSMVEVAPPIEEDFEGFKSHSAPRSLSHNDSAFQ
jgi:hypothetical protein